MPETTNFPGLDVLKRAFRVLWKRLSARLTASKSDFQNSVGVPLAQEVVRLDSNRRLVESETATVEYAGPEARPNGSSNSGRSLTTRGLNGVYPQTGSNAERLKPVSSVGMSSPLRGPAGKPDVFSWDPDAGMTYENFMAVIHPDDRDRVQTQQREAIETGMPVDLEYRIVSPNGQERVVQERGRAEVGTNGSASRFSGTVRDVTEETQTPGSRQDLDTRYQSLLDGVPDAVLVVERETGRIVEANEAASSLFEVPLDALLGRSEADLYPSDHRTSQQSFLVELGTRAEEGRVTVRTRPDGSQLQVETEGGARVPVEISAAVVELEGAQYVVGIFRDVSGRHDDRTHPDVSQQPACQSRDTILIAGADWYATPAPEEFLGSDWTQLVGENPSLFQSGETFDKRYERLWAALERGNRGIRTDRRNGGTLVKREETTALIADADGVGEHSVATGRDVTERIEREQTLREREELLRRQRNLLEQTQRLAGAWEADLENNRMLWSEEVYRIHELRAGTDVTVEESIEYFEPSAQAAFRQAFEQCVDAEEPFDLELPIETAKGNRRWVHIVGAPVAREDGAVTKVAGAVQDLTQRRRMEEALQEREARLRGLANSIPGVVYQSYARPDGSYGHYFVSEHAEEMLGLSPDPDGFHDRFVERVPLEYRDALARSVEKAIEEESPWQFECPFEKPSGERLWLRGLSTPERRNGEIVFNGVILDITERMEAQRALQEESDRFATLFASLPTPVIRGTVRDGEEDVVRVTDVNPAFEDTFGYSADEIEGENLHAFIVPEGEQDGAVQVNKKALEEGTLQTEVKRKTADGLRDFHLQAAMRKRADGLSETYAIYSDISERKRMEKELRARERWIRSITENASGGIFRCTPENGIEYANEAFLSLFGYESFEELRGEEPGELCATTRQRERLAELLNDEAGHHRVEVELERKDGSTFVALLSTTVVPGGDDTPTYYDGVVTDITEEHRRRHRRRRQQEAVMDLTTDEAVTSGRFDAATRKITERAADVLDVARVNVWLLDEDEGQLQCVDQYDRQDDRHFSGAVLPAKTHPRYFEAIKNNRVIEAHDVHSDPRLAEVADGYLDEKGVGALLDATLRSEGEVVGVVCHEHNGDRREWTDDEVQFAGQVADILHRALRNRDQAERRRRIAFQQSLLKAQQEAVLDGVLVVDRDGELISYNDRFAEIWGLPDVLLDEQTDNEALLEHLAQQLCDPQAFLEKVRFLSDHPTETGRDEIEFKDGRVLDRYSTPLIGEQGTHYGRLWTFRDITEQKERERELKRAKEKAEEAAELKTAMLANMSHEIRTPLTTIIGFSEMLREELEGEMAAFAQKSYESSQRLMKTLDSVLQLSKLEAGSHTLERESVQLEKVTVEAVQKMEAEADGKSIALELSLPDRPVVGEWNEGALVRIAENLVENAVKFTPSNGRVDVRVRENGSEAVLEVEDTGIGISEEFRSQMFRAFKQESNGLSREYEGTGLGLSIVQRLVEAFNGRVRIDSEKGEGTCIQVRLPKSRTETEPQ